MASLICRIEMGQQQIPFVGKPKFKFGVRKRESKTDITGQTLASETLEGSESILMFDLDNANKDARDLMIDLYKNQFTRNGGGSIVAYITYDNDPFNPIIFNGGFIENLPEIEDGGTTTYTFKFNSYAETL